LTIWYTFNKEKYTLTTVFTTNHNQTSGFIQSTTQHQTINLKKKSTKILTSKCLKILLYKIITA